MKRMLLALVILALVALPPDSAAGQQAAADTTGAAAAGSAAGNSKSTMGPALYAGSTSLAVPGAGFLFLLFLHEGEVTPNFVEQSQLTGKSPAYVTTWAASYDRALTARQKKSIIVGSVVGTVGGILLYRMLFAGSGCGSYAYC